MTRKFPELHDAETMQYLADRLSQRKVAALLGCARSAVSLAYKRMAVENVYSGRLATRYDVLLDNVVMSVLSQNFTSVEIAGIIGCSLSSVSVSCRRFGIRCIRKKRKTTRTTYDPDQLDESIEHFVAKQACWHKLARKMLKDEWNGEWCK